MKLYWRYKKPDGKWTYRRAEVDDIHYALEQAKVEEE